MRKIFLSTLLIMALGAPAQAGSLHALHGIFCNTEAEIDGSLGFLAQGMSARAAAESVNKDTVACVFADKVRYMIMHPQRLVRAPDGLNLVKYQATLIGVLVGKTVRPVQPPMRIYFLTQQQLEDAITAEGA